MMRVSEQQRKNASARSVEARRRAQQPTPVVDWDLAISKLLAMLGEYGDADDA